MIIFPIPLFSSPPASNPYRSSRFSSINISNGKKAPPPIIHRLLPETSLPSSLFHSLLILAYECPRTAAYSYMMVKCSRLLYMISLSGLVYTVLSCVATSGSGTVVTTTSATVTTTATPSCTSCTASQVTFTQGSGTVQIDTSGTIGTDTTTNCLTLTATCTAATGFYAFMQFNNNQGGPAENANMGRTINALLNCVDGNWVYTSGGVSRIITEVSCNQAPDAG